MRQAIRLSRRQVLRAGTLGALGLGLDQFLTARAARGGSAAAGGFGRAKQCVFFFMWGDPSQLDTFDMKPAAPAEVRGDFQPIATAVPGLQICEHFQRLASWTDRLAVIRSLHHTDPAHLSSAHATLTGHWAPTINSDAAPPSDRDSPQLGAMMSRLRESPADVPAAVSLPWIVSHPAAPGGRAPGQNAGWLGKRFDPLVLEGNPNQPDWTVSELALLDGISVERLEHRRALLNLVDGQCAEWESLAAARGMTSMQEQAFALLSGSRARKAFDLASEPAEVRDRYGRNIHGQCALLARRLIEHGVPLVTINWHNDGHNFWDTHGANFKRLKSELIPPADQALSALLEDLSARGLLDETIVAWVGEFGRKPQINAAAAGREHWPYCYSGLLAGGGIAPGAVYGESDAHAARPKRDPVSPLDFAATIYHALGIDPHTIVPDRTGRPVPVTPGEPIRALFS